MLMKISVSNLKFLCLIVGLISYTSPAFAYLDPGTGSITLQAILGFIAASIAALTFYWNKVKLFLIKLFKKDKKSE